MPAIKPTAATAARRYRVTELNRVTQPHRARAARRPDGMGLERARGPPGHGPQATQEFNEPIQGEIMFKVTDLMLQVVPTKQTAGEANWCFCTDDCTWPTCFPSCMRTFDPSKDAPPCADVIRDAIGANELAVLKAGLRLHMEKLQDWEQALDPDTVERAEALAEALTESVHDLQPITERLGR